MKKIAVAFVAANLLDYVTTIVGLSMGFVELNRFVAELSPASFLLLKTGIIFPILALLVAIRHVRGPLRGVKIGLEVGVVSSSVLLTAISVHNALLIAGYSGNSVFVKFVSLLLGV